MRLGRITRSALVALVLAVIGGLSTLAWQSSSAALRPGWYEPRTPEQGLSPRIPDNWMGLGGDPREELGLDFESVEIPAVDGSTLRGWLVPGESGTRAGVVAVHGAGADRREFLRHLPIFQRLGLPVVLFDCREHGISDGQDRGISLGLRESRDVSSVVAWAKAERGLDRVAVIGTSQGGASVILAAAADPAIDAVIAENPFTSVQDLVRDIRGEDDPVAGWAVALIAYTTLWRMEGFGAWTRPSPLEVVADIAPRPLLLMHGTQDTAIPHGHSERLFAAAGEPRELWILPGGKHAALWNLDPEEFERRVASFLERWLLEPG